MTLSSFWNHTRRNFISWVLLSMVCAVSEAASVSPAGTCMKLIDKAKASESKDLGKAEGFYFQALACNPNVIESQFGAPLVDFKLPSGLNENQAWKKGESIEGKTLLVYAVKGVGDTLQFVRFLPNLSKTKVKKVLFVPQKGLQELLSASFSEQKSVAIEVLEEMPKELGKDDKHVSLLSLPDYLDIQVSDIKGKPYLKVPRTKLLEYKNVLSKTDSKGKSPQANQSNPSDTKSFKIGVVLSGESGHPHNRDRTFSPHDLDPIAKLEKVHLYSLQPGGERLIQEAKDKIAIDTSLIKLLKSYADTAAIIENLDLIISADTSVSHLAAALGKKTFVPLSKKTDLRYAGSGQKTFWYDSMTLFRQQEQGDWKVPFEAIATEIQSILGTRKAPAK